MKKPTETLKSSTLKSRSVGRAVRCLLLISAFQLFSFSAFSQADLSAVAPIRFSGDSFTRYNPSVTDSNTGSSLQFVRGDFVTFDVGLFDKGVLRSNTISQFTNATLGIWTVQNDTNPPLMILTVTNNANTNGWNANCSYLAWSNNSISSFTNWNLEFNFTDSQTSINLNGQAAQGYWLRLYCVTTDAAPKTVTYMEVPVTVYDGPISSVAIPPMNWFESVLVNGNYVLAIRNPVSQHFYTVEIDTVYGIRTLSVGDTPH